MPWVEKISDPQELRLCIRDLVALARLPAGWMDSTPRQIVDSVAATLRGVLKADFVYVTIPASRDEWTVEILHTYAVTDRSIENAIKSAAYEAAKSPVGQATMVANPLGEGTVLLAHAAIHPNAFVVAGSVKSDFPNEIQRILLGLAANEASIALQRWHAEADKRRFVKLIERSSDFVAVLTLDARPSFINPAGYDLVGLSRSDDIFQRYFLDFIAPADWRLLNDHFWPHVLRDGRWGGEIHLRHFGTGESIPVLVDAFRIDNPGNGELMSIVTVSRDLRAQKQAEMELRRLNDTLEERVAARTAELAEAHQQRITAIARRDATDARLQELHLELSHAGRLGTSAQMAATIAHELSQPLTAITNSANAARRSLANIERGNIATVNEIMDEIVQYSIRATQILRRLRDFVTCGEIERLVENVPSMIEDAISFTIAHSSAVIVAVKLNFDPAAITVLANRIQVQEVLVNLMRNAFEAMTRGVNRSLQVTTTRLDQQTVEIAIADTGPGLAAEVALRLFEPFVSTKRNGMGLGLSLCRSIVRAHGGELRYEANPAGGAIFRFTLRSQ
jgi:PAS domain S-box-containing protein